MTCEPKKTKQKKHCKVTVFKTELNQDYVNATDDADGKCAHITSSVSPSAAEACRTVPVTV